MKSASSNFSFSFSDQNLMFILNFSQVAKLWRNIFVDVMLVTISILSLPGSFFLTTYEKWSAGNSRRALHKC